MGLELSLSASASTQYPVCTTGSGGATFGGSSSLKVSVSGANKLCTEEITFGGEVNFTSSSRTCGNCNTSSCEYESDISRACKTAGGSGSVSLGKNWRYQLSVSRGIRGGRVLPSVSISATCGALVGVSGQVTVGADARRNQGFDCPSGDCTDCSTTTAGLTLSGNAAIQCSATLTAGRMTRQIGCETCGSAFVSLGGEVTARSGQCGAQTCGKLTGSMGGTAGPLRGCVQLGWFLVQGEVKATSKISGTYDSCAGGSWTPDADVSFDVTSGYGDCE